MLENEYFYFEMIRRYIVAFSYIISDIEVVRTNSAGTEIKRFFVPYTYAAKSKIFYREQRNSDIKEKVNKKLPLISFLFKEMEYDEERAENNLEECVLSTVDSLQESITRPVPYNFNIDVKIKTKYLDDMYQIIEQIATIFDRYRILTVNNTATGSSNNVSILLNNILLPTEMNFLDDSNRILTSDLNFTLKGYLFPSTQSGPIIDKIDLSFQGGKNIEVGDRWETIISTSYDIEIVNQ